MYRPPSHAASSSAAAASYSHQYAASAAAASSSSSVAASAAAAASATGNTGADEYPASVQELVMNGFELQKVLHAYDLIGDNFDDLLSFLLSSAT